MEHNKIGDRKNTFIHTVPSISINKEKVKYPERVANTFKSLFLTIDESLHLHKAVEEDAISFQKIIFPLISLVLKLS